MPVYHKTVLPIVLGAILLGVLTAGRCSADASPGARFSFVIPWDNARSNVTDVSWLNDGRAGGHGDIVVKGGHFVESGTGRRVRFFGANICLAGLFPNHEDAEKLAAHLAMNGVNLVRLHHQDATWAGPDDSLWDPKFKDHRHIDPVKLEKMDYLVSRLEAHGIYIDMCLHVARKLIPEDGFPDSVKKIPFMFDKRVDEFDRKMIAVDKEYFRGLLTHVNPHTRLAYARDPGLLNVEINNENSLVGLYGDVAGNGLAGLPEPYGSELKALWNAWLARRYGSTARLAAAWKGIDATHGPDLYPWSADPVQWRLEFQPGTAATLTRDGDALRVDIARTDDTNWHVQLYRKGLGLLQNGKTYTLSFAAKADRERNQPISANLDHPDYRDLGLSTSVALSSEWRRFTITFQAKSAEEGQNRLPTLHLGSQTGAVWLRGVTLKEGIGAFELPADERIETKSVAVAPSGQDRPRADWLLFLAHTEDAYVAEMTAYLRKDLGVRPLIVCSQVGFGDLYGVYRENRGDYADNHSYWELVDAPTMPVPDQPMVRALGKSDALSEAARSRIEGVPYTITEYNHNFPNDYRAECLPEYASFAASQDWDAIYLFCQGDYGAPGVRNGNLDRIAFAYDTDRDPAIAGFLPGAALIFRAGLVPPDPTVRTALLPAQFPAERVAAGLTTAKVWEEKGVRPLDSFVQRIALRLGPGRTVAVPAGAVTSALHVENDDPATARFLADAPAAKAIAGFVGDRRVTLDGLTVRFGTLTDRFGALTVVAMDRKPLASSSCILLTLVTRTQNTAQEWNATRTQLTQLGRGPILADAAWADAEMAADGPRQVYALDSRGERAGLIPSRFVNGKVAFSITPDAKTIWYSIVKP